MRSALNFEGCAAAVALQLGRAFTQLFDGIAGSKAVSLYESGHVGVSRRLFQAPVVSMGRLLRKSDLSIDDRFCEPPDHLSIELALLARLIRTSISILARKRHCSTTICLTGFRLLPTDATSVTGPAFTRVPRK